MNTDRIAAECIQYAGRYAFYNRGDGTVYRVEDVVHALLGERDRARATAVALEQQLAQVEHEMQSLERHYQADLDSGWTAERDAALDAVYDCTSSVEVITDVVGNDRCEDEFPVAVPLAQAREGTG